MASRANRSNVWESFEKLSATKVKCKLCANELSVRGGVTSSMHGHLNSKHPGVVESSKAHASSAPSITGFLQHRNSCPDSKQEQISVALAKLIAENTLPISIVDCDSLRQLFHLLEPQYKVPCRQTMTSRLDAMKVKMSSDLTERLQNVPHIAVTTDIWTSVANEAYLSFTACYIESDWTMKTPVLATVPMEERHTQAVIADHLSAVAKEWKIDNKVVACVHDGAANVKDVGARNKWLDVNCAAHKLQLCINSAMGTDKVSNHPIAKCVGAASRLVGHFSHSPMAVGELIKRQASMFPDKQPRKLTQYCKTRWNSVCDMFARLVDLRWPVCAVLSDRNVVKPSDAKTLELKDDQWQLMTDLLPVLHPLQVATSVMSTESSPSSAMLYPMLWGLINNHLQANADDSSATAAFKRSVADAVKQRFGLLDESTASNTFVIASVLDPKFKHLPGTPI